MPLRWVLIRDPQGRFAPQALLCTDLAAEPAQVLAWFVLRWQLEVTFAEARRHTDSAIGLAEDARKYSRAEAFLLSVQAEAEAARKAGADLTEAREIVAQAREALRNGVYADVQKFSRLAGVAIREARRFSQEEVPIKIAERTAVLDILSGGRVEVGTGRSATWTELAGFNADPDDTKKSWDEFVRCLPKMWTSDTYEFEGEFWTTFFDDSTEQAVAALLDLSRNKLSPEELERLSTLIEEARKEGR